MVNEEQIKERIGDLEELKGRLEQQLQQIEKQIISITNYRQQVTNDWVRTDGKLEALKDLLDTDEIIQKEQ